MARDHDLEPVAADVLDGAERVAETHVSNLFFVGDRVYKQKKPVDMGFLDFSNAGAREAACRREVELNRRLAPDAYLGVAGLVDPAGHLTDHLVVMRRMPDDRRLATLVQEGADLGDEILGLARLVATFHASPATEPTMPEAASAASVRATWDASFDDMRRFVGSLLPAEEFGRVVALARAYIDGRHPLFEHRIADGWARDGHGDLQADDIFCLADGPRVLDCLEFDDRLRHGDVLADVGFLAMDLERLGRPDLAHDFLDAYEEFSGERHPRTLAEHYVAARAHVRAKVACLRYEQGDAASADQARRLHAMSRRHLEAAQVPLVLVGGIPGTGKSTLAARVADDRGWTVLCSDAIRKERAGHAPSDPAPADFETGLYSRPATDETYEVMLERARVLLGMGEPVILDASWTARRHRRQARHVAAEVRSPLVELSCEAPLDVVTERIGRRTGPTEGVRSDADAEIALEVSRRADDWSGAASIDARRSAAEMYEQANQVIEGALSGAAGPDPGSP